MAAIKPIWFPNVMHTCPCGTHAYECHDLRGINDACALTQKRWRQSGQYGSPVSCTPALVEHMHNSVMT
eukprot:1142255-Pelagomonas_calceolata.AAC.3